MVVATDIHGTSLRGIELLHDLRFILFQRFRDAGKSGLQFLVLRLLYQRLGPIERQIEVASARVHLADFRRRRFVALEELAISAVQSRRENESPGVTCLVCEVLDGNSQSQKLSERIPPQVPLLQ